MTTTDKTIHYFVCPTCGSKDEIALRERGYFGNTSWEEGKDSSFFEIKWTEPKHNGPEVVECICKRCGVPAEHRIV